MGCWAKSGSRSRTVRRDLFVSLRHGTLVVLLTVVRIMRYHLLLLFDSEKAGRSSWPDQTTVNLLNTNDGNTFRDLCQFVTSYVLNKTCLVVSFMRTLITENSKSSALEGCHHTSVYLKWSVLVAPLLHPTLLTFLARGRFVCTRRATRWIDMGAHRCIASREHWIIPQGWIVSFAVSAVGLDTFLTIFGTLPTNPTFLLSAIICKVSMTHCLKQAEGNECQWQLLRASKR